MFGYIRPLKAELKVRELEQYQGVYCGLCHQLGRSYGVAARFTLSYDFSFLALLGMSVRRECGGFSKQACAFNPLRKKACCKETPTLSFTTDVAMLMLWYKLRDNIEDSRFLKRTLCRLAVPVAAAARRKAERRHPELSDKLRESIGKQREVEGRAEGSVDLAAEPTALALSAVCEALSDEAPTRRILSRFGYMLGRCLYLIDALDDLESDHKDGDFNPFLPGGQRDAPDFASIRASATTSLHHTRAEMIAAYQLLDLPLFKGILDNILFLGLDAVTAQVTGGPSTASAEPGKGADASWIHTKY